MRNIFFWHDIRYAEMNGIDRVPVDHYSKVSADLLDQLIMLPDSELKLSTLPLSILNADLELTPTSP